MKTTELMLNNWVKISANNTPIKVAAIHEKEIGYYIQNELKWINIEDIEPIPLTPSILEKYNIHYQSEIPWWQYEKDAYGIGDRYEINLSNETTFYLEYVHDLQNIINFN